MFDTNVFNRILDGEISLQNLKGCVVAHATHIQRDELNNTKEPKRRADLTQVFERVFAESPPTDYVVPTCSAVWDVSRWDQAKWGADDNLYSMLKDDLDKKRRKRNNL